MKYSYGNVKKIKAAFKAVKEKDLNYKTKVGTTLVVGALGGTVMGGAGSILARYAMSPAISGTVAVFAHRRVKASKKDLIKNRSVAAYQRYKSAKQARTSANVSVAVSGASAVFFGAQAAHNHAEVIGAVAKLDNTADWNNILTQAQTSSLSAKLAHELGMSKPWYNPGLAGSTAVMTSHRLILKNCRPLWARLSRLRKQHILPTLKMLSRQWKQPAPELSLRLPLKRY